LDAEQIRKILSHLRITQVELASRLDVDPSRVTRWLQDEPPSRSHGKALEELYRKHVLGAGQLTPIKIGICCEFSDTTLVAGFSTELQSKFESHALQFVPCPWDNRCLEALFRTRRIDMVFYNKFAATRFLLENEAAIQINEALCQQSGGSFLGFSVSNGAIEKSIEGTKLGVRGFLAMLEEAKKCVIATSTASEEQVTTIRSVVKRLITETDLLPLGISKKALAVSLEDHDGSMQSNADLGSILRHVIKGACEGSNVKSTDVLGRSIMMPPGMCAAIVAGFAPMFNNACLVCSGGHDQRAMLELVGEDQLKAKEDPERWVFCVPVELLDIGEWQKRVGALWCLLVREQSMVPLASKLNDELNGLRKKYESINGDPFLQSELDAARREIMAWHLLHNSRYLVSGDPGIRRRLAEFSLTAKYSDYVGSWFGPSKSDTRP
jgi:hypothetical protein